MEDINCVFEGLGGVGSIYISNIKAAQNPSLVSSTSGQTLELNIKSMISVLSPETKIKQNPEIVTHLRISVDDSIDENISKHFD